MANEVKPAVAGASPTHAGSKAQQAFNTAADGLRGLIDRTIISGGFAPDPKALAQAQGTTGPAAAPTADQAAWRSSHGYYATNTQIPSGSAQNLFQSHFAMFRPDASGHLGLDSTQRGIYELLISTRPNANPVQQAALHAVADTAAVTILGGFAAQAPSVLVQPIDPKHPLTLDLNKANALIHSADDSGVYTKDGKVDNAKFDALWSNFSKGKNYLTAKDFSDMRTANLDPNAPPVKRGVAEVASFAEFTLLGLVAGRPQGQELVIDKPTLRAFYDGTLFPKMMVSAETNANAQSAKEAKSSGWLSKPLAELSAIGDSFKP